MPILNFFVGNVGYISLKQTHKSTPEKRGSSFAVSDCAKKELMFKQVPI